MSTEKKSMPYGRHPLPTHTPIVLTRFMHLYAVRLGKSGLKVSKIILGCMSYGSKGWAEWVIEDQEEVTKHIKFASVPTSLSPSPSSHKKS